MTGTKTYKGFSTKETPQSERIPGSKQVQNDAGGYSFQIDSWGKLNRFLILGSEGGTYYASEHKLTKENAKNVLKCIEEDGHRVVNTIVEISDAGRAPKNDPALFALAACASFGDDATKKAAFRALPQVARIGTHLFHFAAYVEQFRGWGRGLREAVGDWYTSKSPKDLAFQAVKYQSRDGWSHYDLLRLSHVALAGEGREAVARWITDGMDGFGKKVVKDKNGKIVRKYPAIDKSLLPDIIVGFEKAKTVEDEDEIVKLIEKYKLTFEMVPTQFHTSAKVYDAILPNLGLTAIIRNLGNMSKSGYLAKGQWEAKDLICEKITNAEALKKARVHPIALLSALNTYNSGHSVRGKGEWEAVPDVCDALEKAFYLSFGYVEPAGKRFILALDVSGSMGVGEIAGVPGLTPAMAAAAMAMVTYKTEKKTELMAFAHEFRAIDISRCEKLETVLKKTDCNNFGGTDCALPMLWALQKGIQVDAFIVYTDSETWFGSIHPSQAIAKYRKETGIPAKLIVVGMTANDFTIADPKDSGMMDVVGFDTAAPDIMTQFVAGRGF